MIENSPDTITRYGRDLRRIYANPAFCASVGRSLGESLGKRPSEIPGGANALTLREEDKRRPAIFKRKKRAIRVEMDQQGWTGTMRSYPPDTRD